MKIGVMGAMVEEVRQIKEIMHIEESKTIAGRDYHKGLLENSEVTLVFSHWGKVASASTVTTLINKFDVDFIVFMGVAGAVDKRLNIGDVVIGESLYQHDMDATPLFKKFEIPLIKKILFAAKEKHIDAAFDAAKSFVVNIKNEINEAQLKKFFIKNPKVYKGIIASGDQFVTNPHSHPDLKLPSGEVLAVEMEGAAIAQVCDAHETPFIVIRIISDKADHSAHIDFMKFVNNIACLYSAGIVKKLVKNSSNALN